jgi:nucleoid DNA-binding protein
MLLGKTVPPEVLKKMREKAGYTQAELADLLGVSKRTIVTREQKESNISFSEFERMIMLCSNTPEERAQNKKFLRTIKDAFSGFIAQVQ